MYKKIITLLIVVYSQPLYCRTTTCITPRSPTNNIARYLIGWEKLIDNSITQSYVTGALMPSVSQSFRQDRVAESLFGDLAVDHKISFNITGSLVANRDSSDWLADYFYLPPDFNSTVRVRPTVTNTLFFFYAYAALNALLPGLYAFVQVPFQHSRWDMNLFECIKNAGSHEYDSGYVTPESINRVNLLSNFKTFITGQTIRQPQHTSFVPLRYAKIACKPLHKHGVPEVQCAVGYNLCASADYHIGGFIFTDIPGGNKPEAEFLFESIVGNGHLWQVGIGITGHIGCWWNEATDEYISLHGGCLIGHLFSTHQRRSFDLCDKENSRYMLAAQMNRPIIDNLAGEKNGILISPTAQFKNVVTPIANLTTSPIRIGIPWCLDVALMISYSQCHFTWSLGYGIWARASDRITRIPCSLLDDDTAQWAIKGDAQLFGFEETTNNPIPLSISQTNATIHIGGNINAQSGTTTSPNNAIDFPSPSFSDSTNSMIIHQVTTIISGSTVINSSIQPKLLSPDDIDIDSARTRGCSQKIFGQFTHLWPDCDATTPYLGFGAEAEIGPKWKCHTSQKIVNCALSAWAIWLKGGIRFN